jgi:hypothetical protein
VVLPPEQKQNVDTNKRNDKSKQNLKKIQQSQKPCSAVAGLVNKINSHKTRAIKTKKRLAIQAISTPTIP